MTHQHNNTQSVMSRTNSQQQGSSPPPLTPNNDTPEPRNTNTPPELYSLKWNDYIHNLQSVFKYLRETEEFTDVTIACLHDDNIQEHFNNDKNGIVCFKAHKIILAACSGFFHSVLSGQPQGSSQPIVYLKDVRAGVFKNILSFVYYGEVQVANTDLPEFLSVAASLKIKGLVRNTSQNESTPVAPPPLPPVPAPPQPQRQQTPVPTQIPNPPPLPPSDPTPKCFSRNGTVSPQPNAPVTPTPPEEYRSWGGNAGGVVPPRPQSLASDDEDSKYYDGSQESFKPYFKQNPDEHDFVLKSPYGSRIRATDPRPCPKCGKIYRSAHTLRTHLEDKHTICPGYRCVLCGTVAKSRNSLHSHMSRQHRGISTKDLPVIPMPAPFDPELANRLLAKIGGGAKVDVSRYADVEEEEDDSGGEEIIRETENTAVSVNASTPPQQAPPQSTKQARSAGGAAPGTHPPTCESPQPGTGSAILDTYLQLIAENSSAMFAAAAAAAAAAAQASGKPLPPLPPHIIAQGEVAAAPDPDCSVAKRRKQEHVETGATIVEETTDKHDEMSCTVDE
ncbi:unnamed protein product [Orchesella dallaii]|uniref:Protein abrupt n=1 Tax=Orchesella dallaii TaxID=48710 RepID=A0ABP1PM89_9HEXA